MGTIISLTNGGDAPDIDWTGLQDYGERLSTAASSLDAISECAKKNVEILLVDKACHEDIDSLVARALMADAQLDIIIFSCDPLDVAKYESQVNIHLFAVGMMDDPIGLQSTIKRVLHTRQCTLARRELEAWSNDFLDNAIVLIQSVDPSGKLIYTNRTWREVLGYSADDVKMMNLMDVIDPDCLPKCMERFQEVMAGKDPGIVEAEFRTKAGRKVFVEGQVNCRFVDGKPAYTRGIFRDITTKKLAEEALLMANKKLNLMNGIVRHDVLNQLMVLSGYLELSEVKNDIAVLRKYHEKEMAAVATIDRLISFTKVYQDIGVKAPIWNNIGDLVPIMASALKDSEAQLAVSDIGVEIFADQMFGQVLYNLVDNTAKYAKNVSRISLSWEEGASEGVLIYQDDGQGISLEDKERIFERGYGHNTGLGLFLVREILSFTDLKIVENGIPGKGARFEIRVPPACYRVKASGAQVAGSHR